MNLAALQHHVLFRLSTFSHKILNIKNSPQKLKEMILNKSSSNYMTRSSKKTYNVHIPLNLMIKLYLNISFKNSYLKSV